MVRQRTATSAVYTISVSTEMMRAIESHCDATGEAPAAFFREAVRKRLRLPKSSLELGKAGPPKRSEVPETAGEK